MNIETKIKTLNFFIELGFIVSVFILWLVFGLKAMLAIVFYGLMLILQYIKSQYKVEVERLDGGIYESKTSITTRSNTDERS